MPDAALVMGIETSCDETGVALVRAGATFEKGKLVERPEESGDHQHVA